MGAIKCNDTLAVSIHRIRNSDLNEHGTVYGGRILELIDGQASVAAMRVAQDSMCMEAYVTGFRKRSIEVFTKVIGEHLMTGERFLGFYCFMTFVILDPEKQTAFNKLIPETEEQKTLMATYSQRVKQRQIQRQKQQEFLPHISISKPW